ncbi:MAG: hypothetical protein H6708_06560 [Kofleriaceae bacterium]|nr:hypothetical protein [Kofleriaceae bacterium]
MSSFPFAVAAVAVAVAACTVAAPPAAPPQQPPPPAVAAATDLLPAPEAAVAPAEPAPADTWAAEPAPADTTAAEPAPADTRAAEPPPPPPPKAARAATSPLDDVLDGDDAAGVTFVAWPEQRTVDDEAWGPVLTDVARHLATTEIDPYWQGGTDDSGRATDGHEGTHGIQYRLRNYGGKLAGFTGRDHVNGFYVLRDRAVILLEPPVSKTEVGPRVPASLRGHRYDLYIAHQEGWNDRPLYVLDEWSAYCNGAAVDIDRAQRGLTHRGFVVTDAIMGPLEFGVYAIAVVRAVAEVAPDYLRDHPELAAFVAWNLRRAMGLYRLGRAITELAWTDADTYLDALRTGDDAADLRGFVRDTWGEAWARDVLGF